MKVVFTSHFHFWMLLPHHVCKDTVSKKYVHLADRTLLSFDFSFF